MFEYEKFDIVEVAEICGIKINSRTLEKKEVEAWCPFCPTESSDYHMYLNRQKESFFCHKCSVSGNSVVLYGKIFGISNKEAANRLIHGAAYVLPKREPPKPKVPGYEIAPIHQRHDVYFDMLFNMELSGNHHENLRNRGLSSERIEKNMYRSMPESKYKRREIAQRLSRHHDLRGVPGFYYSPYGHWELAGSPGILIPICDRKGYIQGLQIRLDNVGKRKYRWLSSNPDNNYPYGTPSSTWVHVTGNRDGKECEITEGALKGDVASYLSGDRLYVCTAGVSSIGYLSDTLTALRPSKVNGCYDMDQLDALKKLEALREQGIKEAMKSCPLEKMEKLVMSMGIPYERWEWTETNKIDDYYLYQLTQRQAA